MQYFLFCYRNGEIFEPENQENVYKIGRGGNARSIEISVFTMPSSQNFISNSQESNETDPAKVFCLPWLAQLVCLTDRSLSKYYGGQYSVFGLRRKKDERENKGL